MLNGRSPAGKRLRRSLHMAMLVALFALIGCALVVLLLSSSMITDRRHELSGVSFSLPKQMKMLAPDVHALMGIDDLDTDHGRNASRFDVVLGVLRTHHEIELAGAMLRPESGLVDCVDSGAPHIWIIIDENLQSFEAIAQIYTHAKSCSERVSLRTLQGQRGEPEFELAFTKFVGHVFEMSKGVQGVIKIPLGSVMTVSWKALSLGSWFRGNAVVDSQRLGAFVLPRSRFMLAMSVEMPKGAKDSLEARLAATPGTLSLQLAAKDSMAKSGPLKWRTLFTTPVESVTEFRGLVHAMRVSQVERSFDVLAGDPAVIKTEAFRDCTERLYLSGNLHDVPGVPWKNSKVLEDAGMQTVLKLLNGSMPATLGPQLTKNDDAVEFLPVLYLVRLRNEHDLAMYNAHWNTRELEHLSAGGHGVVLVADQALWETDVVPLQVAGLDQPLKSSNVHLVPRELSFPAQFLGETYMEMVGHLYALHKALEFAFCITVELDRVPLHLGSEASQVVRRTYNKLSDGVVTERAHRYKAQVSRFAAQPALKAANAGPIGSSDTVVPRNVFQCLGLALAPKGNGGMVEVTRPSRALLATKSLSRASMYRVYVERMKETRDFVRWNSHAAILDEQFWMGTLLIRSLRVRTDYNFHALVPVGTKAKRSLEDTLADQRLLFGNSVLKSPADVASVGKELLKLRAAKRKLSPECAAQLVESGNLATHDVLDWNKTVSNAEYRRVRSIIRTLSYAIRSVPVDEMDGPVVWLMLVHRCLDLDLLREMQGNPLSPMQGEIVLLIPDERLWRDTTCAEQLSGEGLPNRFPNTVVLPREYALMGAWAGTTLVYKELIGYAYAVSRWPTLSHVALLTPTAVPIKGKAEIHARLKKGQSLVQVMEQGSKENVRDRLGVFIWECKGMIHWFSQPKLDFDKPNRIREGYSKGTQWRVLSGDILHDMFREDGRYHEDLFEFLEFFRFTLVPDEMFTPTFFNVVVPKERYTSGTLIYIDWKYRSAELGWGPETVSDSFFDAHHEQTSASSPFVFTRKVESVEVFRATLERFFGGRGLKQ